MDDTHWSVSSAHNNLSFQINLPHPVSGVRNDESVNLVVSWAVRFGDSTKSEYYNLNSGACCISDFTLFENQIFP